MMTDNSEQIEMTSEIQDLAEEYFLRADRARAPKRVKKAWIALARRCFQPSDRQPCIICCKFRVLAEAHHVIPLEAQYDRGFTEPDHRHVWLCPNHHQLLHVYIAGSDRKITATIADNDLSEDEWQAIFRLRRWSGGNFDE
jgi:hypothetical protein